MALTLTLLGAPLILLDGVPLTITTRKATALLAYLAVTGTPHTREALATLLWPESDTEHARGALRFTLAQLRSALGAAWLTVSRDQIGLARREDLTVDVTAFDALIGRLRAHAHALREPCAVCLPLQREAVALHRGPLLAGFSLPDSPAFDDWLLFESERLQRAQADLLVALVSGYRAAGTPAEAVPYAQRWVALDPFADDANHVLLELLLGSGQRSAARRHFAVYSKLLRDELDAEPSDATTALIERMSRSADSADTDARASRPQRAPQTSPTAPRSSRLPELPSTASPLLGRAHELNALGRLLDDPACRILTMVGPGGSGKTRLAIALADARRSMYTHGVAWVALAGVESPAALAALIATALGCPLAADEDARQRLLDYLQARHLLLLLDNLEQLLPHDADDPTDAVDLIERIAVLAPEVQLVLTSRVRLQLYEEQVYPIQGLVFPDWDNVSDAHSYAAVQLFVARARRAQPGFSLTPTTAPAVQRIVRVLAGQPLAIELAAGWVGSLTPDDIADELDRGIDVLATNMRNVPARHRSMRASYGLSWQQLRPSEKAVQQALSVFRGGFSREAAAHIAGASALDLRTLSDQSLLTQSGDERPRYGVHEVLRQFAAEHLAQSPQAHMAVGNRHAAYFLNWIGRSISGSLPPSPATLQAVELEFENVQAAWSWAVAQRDVGLLTVAIDAVCTVLAQRGRTTDGIAACERVIGMLDGQADDRDAGRLLGQALTWKAAYWIGAGQIQPAQALLERSFALLSSADDRRALAYTCLVRGRLAFLAENLADAQPWLEQALVLYHAAGHRIGEARALTALGRVAWLAGANSAARKHYADCLAVYRAIGDSIGSAHTLAELVLPTIFDGHVEQGMAMLTESRALSEELSDPVEAASIQRHLASTLYYLGHNDDAKQLYQACIAGDQHIGNRLLEIDDRIHLALLQVTDREFDRATATLAPVLALRSETKSDRYIGFALALLGLAEFGRGAYDSARALLEESLVTYRGTHLGDDPIITYWGLSQVARVTGDLDKARRHAVAGVRLAAAGRGVRGAVVALSTLAAVLADAGEVERAIEIETLVLGQPYVVKAGFFFDLLVEPLAARSAHLPDAAMQAARARGSARELATTLVEVLAAEQA